METEIKLHVEVDRVGYKKSETLPCWMIINTDQGTCKGNMVWEPKSGEKLILKGRWSAYQGKKEFKFTAAMPDVPEDPQAQLHYVCNITPGVGDALEARIWETVGDKWKDIEAGDIKGLTGKKYTAFTDAIEYMTRGGIHVETIAFLLSKGCSINMADAAWELWKTDAIGKVQADCFCLSELPNYGFQNCDPIRINFQIADNDPRRIQAGIIYALKQSQKSGSTIIEWDALLTKSQEILKAAESLIVNTAGQMLGTEALAGFPDTAMIALPADFYNETIIWEFVA